jgi:hypothetical protein
VGQLNGTYMWLKSFAMFVLKVEVSAELEYITQMFVFCCRRILEVQMIILK